VAFPGQLQVDPRWGQVDQPATVVSGQLLDILIAEFFQVRALYFCGAARSQLATYATLCINAPVLHFEFVAPLASQLTFACQRQV